MGDAGFYRGTSAEQDSRFTDKQKKLLKQMRFEEILSNKVDIRKVSLDIVKPWITRRVNDILGVEDDVVIEYVFSQLEEQNPDPKLMQINLTGFLNAKRAREFMAELWQHMVDAQDTEDGIPPALIELKKEELRRKEEEEAQEVLRKKEEAAAEEKDSIRERPERDRGDWGRGGGRGRDRWAGGGDWGRREWTARRMEDRVPTRREKFDEAHKKRPPPSPDRHRRYRSSRKSKSPPVVKKRPSTEPESRNRPRRRFTEQKTEGEREKTRNGGATPPKPRDRSLGIVGGGPEREPMDPSPPVFARNKSPSSSPDLAMALPIKVPKQQNKPESAPTKRLYRKRDLSSSPEPPVAYNSAKKKRRSSSPSEGSPVTTRSPKSKKPSSPPRSFKLKMSPPRNFRQKSPDGRDRKAERDTRRRSPRPKRRASRSPSPSERPLARPEERRRPPPSRSPPKEKQAPKEKSPVVSISKQKQLPDLRDKSEESAPDSSDNDDKKKSQKRKKKHKKHKKHKKIKKHKKEKSSSREQDETPPHPFSAEGRFGNETKGEGFGIDEENGKGRRDKLL